eukprot:13586502-Heterocapsa_arctica.AAC.1
MKEKKEWTEATNEKKLIMVCHHLSTTKMKTEQNYIAAFGAVRMTKEEATEMITNGVRYQNFW